MLKSQQRESSGTTRPAWGNPNSSTSRKGWGSSTPKHNNSENVPSSPWKKAPGALKNDDDFDEFIKTLDEEFNEDGSVYLCAQRSTTRDRDCDTPVSKVEKLKEKEDPYLRKTTPSSHSWGAQKELKDQYVEGARPHSYNETNLHLMYIQDQITELNQNILALGNVMLDILQTLRQQDDN